MTEYPLKWTAGNEPAEDGALPLTGASDPITYAYLETTNFCNLDCAYCNRRDVVQTARHMSLENWEVVLQKLAGHPIREAKLMGLGEPFMHPQFHTICRRFRETFPEAFTIVATNCQYRITENFTKALPYISLLYLSIDGWEEHYEKDRAGATWPRLLEFLDQLSTIDRGKTRITINCVVTTENYGDIPRLHELVRTRYPFIEEVRLNLAQWWSEDEDCPVDFVSVGSDFYNTLVKYRANVKGKAPWTFSQCFWPQSGLYMDVNGDVKICCLNTSTAPIGNLFRQPLEEIMNATKRLAVRRECASDTPGAHCRKCDYKRLAPVLERIFKAEAQPVC